MTRDAIRAALAAHALFPFPDVLAPEARRDAAVLVPLVLGPDPAVTLAVRPRTMREHPGEIVFPGGKPEPGDADLCATALRETAEELGRAVPRDAVLGRLNSVPVATSRHRLNPFVAAIDPGPWRPSGEVARVIDLPLSAVLSGAVPYRASPVRWAGADVTSPFFDLDGDVLFGATAHVLVELLGVLGPILGTRLPPPELVDPPEWMRGVAARVIRPES